LEAWIGPFPVEGRTPIPAFSHKDATPFANPGIQLIILPVLADGERIAPSPNHRHEVLNNQRQVDGTIAVVARGCLIIEQGFDILSLNPLNANSGYYNLAWV